MQVITLFAKTKMKRIELLYMSFESRYIYTYNTSEYTVYVYKFS